MNFNLFVGLGVEVTPEMGCTLSSGWMLTINPQTMSAFVLHPVHAPPSAGDVGKQRCVLQLSLCCRGYNGEHTVIAVTVGPEC